MNTINAILEPDGSGHLHLPLPDELRRGKVRVMATLEAVAVDPIAAAEAERQRQQRLMEFLEYMWKRDPFRSIEDPVAWQREMREDVVLPGRE